MEASRPAARRTLTPAVLLATAFVTACAVIAVGFVTANGGLQVPQLALATATGSEPAGSATTATPGPTTAGAPSPAASDMPSPSAPAPTLEPTLAPTPAPSVDPLTALSGCPDHPGCYLYTVRRGDTLSTVGDRWGISVFTLLALNPQVGDPSTIVVGETLYLGRSPIVRLDRCPDVAGCYMYVVRPGDRLSTIAGRYGTTTTAILALNPSITDPNAIYSGTTIRLPGPA